MERDIATTSYTSSSQGKGAGGKHRKTSSRRPSASPYARPPPPQTAGGRWISKLVNPARRLFASGATRILPSFFSKSDPPSDDHDHDNLATEVENGTISSSQDITLKDGICELAEEEHSEELIGKQQRPMNFKDDLGVSDIEKLVEGNKFSRDEIDRLIRIMNSRVADPPSPEQKKKSPSIVVRQEVIRPTVIHETPRSYFEEKKQETNAAAIRGTWTPYQSTTKKLQDKVGASPIDIAKAYMERRTSEVGIIAKSAVTTDEQSDDFALKSIVPSPVPKSAICWPGSMGKVQPGYLTPQSARARYGLQRFPRTPYSRNINSNSKSKFPQVQADNSRLWNGTSTPLQQIQASSDQKVDFDKGNGSLGPIRRTRQKLVSEKPARGSPYFKSPFYSSPTPHMSSSTADDFFSAKRNLETRVTEGAPRPFLVYGNSKTSQGSISTVPPRSSHIARTILEHLERNPPTPREKSAELKSVMAWKKSSSSDMDATKQNEGNDSLLLQGSSSRTVDLGVKNYGKLDKGGHSFLKVRGEDNSSEANDAINNKATSASGIFAESSLKVHGSDAAPSQKIGKDINFQSSSIQEDLSKNVPNAARGSEISNQSRAIPSNFSGAKPTLPSISVSKPVPTWAFSSDNSAGFTFPISKSSGVSSEPPTPSILPLSSSSSLDQPTEIPDIPSYQFGSKKSSPGLVFSFPSTSSVSSVADDSTEPKFDFGSDTKSRISFSSAVKGAAVCC